MARLVLIGFCVIKCPRTLLSILNEVGLLHSFICCIEKGEGSRCANNFSPYRVERVDLKTFLVPQWIGHSDAENKAS